MDAEHEREREGRPSGVGDRGFHQLQEQSKAPDPPPNTAASLLWSGRSEEALFCLSLCSCSVSLSNYCDRVLLRNGSSNSREEHNISVADVCEADASLGIENQLCSARYRRKGNIAAMSMVPLRVEQHKTVPPLSLQHHGQALWSLTERTRRPLLSSCYVVRRRERGDRDVLFFGTVFCFRF